MTNEKCGWSGRARSQWSRNCCPVVGRRTGPLVSHHRRSYMISLGLFISPQYCTRPDPKPADLPGASRAVTGRCSRKASPQRPGEAQ